MSQTPGWTPPPSQPATTPRRRSPGWAGAISLATISAIVAGLLGGYVGGWLEDSNDTDGYSLPVDDTPIQGSGSAGGTVPSGGASRPAGSVADIAAKAVPSVVTIKVRSGTQGSGTGSGWVLDASGHVVTNNHVVESATARGSIQVQLADGTLRKATLVGRDASYDLAVLKTSATGLKPLSIGASSNVVVGDEVVAVGAPLGLSSTVTSGIVSALDRPVTAGDGPQRSYLNAIQTDAAINPGNSGGPLLDLKGRVVGVNSAIAQLPGAGAGPTQGGSIGVGFAIPSDQVRRTVEQLIRDGKAVHPVIGVMLDLEHEGQGVKVLDRADAVSPGGPAEKAGIRRGDVIVAFNGRPVSNPDQLVVLIRARNVGETVTLTVRRGDRDRDVKMTLEASAD
ncbi:S1C family serine protease [Kribbia dieselivorans]|uniref:S1C family serine protease n=1 Tax=Kribbia dieselivorans TaxID=331526 RepID=UPI0009FA2E4A|nr:trypsin-like peptidase domain-containing protein [Kribbia dieselivorans]